jgi:hypothetical protein
MMQNHLVCIVQTLLRGTFRRQVQFKALCSALVLVMRDYTGIFILAVLKYIDIKDRCNALYYA